MAGPGALLSGRCGPPAALALGPAPMLNRSLGCTLHPRACKPMRHLAPVMGDSVQTQKVWAHSASVSRGVFGGRGAGWGAIRAVFLSHGHMCGPGRVLPFPLPPAHPCPSSLAFPSLFPSPEALHLAQAPPFPDGTGWGSELEDRPGPSLSRSLSQQLEKSLSQPGAPTLTSQFLHDKASFQPPLLSLSHFLD